MRLSFFGESDEGGMMRRDEAKKIVDKALEEFAEQLEAGCSDKLLQFLASMAQFHEYSVFNSILISCQRACQVGSQTAYLIRSVGSFVDREWWVSACWSADSIRT